MYERRSRLSKKVRDRLLEHFVAGTTARAAAELAGVHRNTAAGFYTRLRQVIADELATASPVAGEVEVDESYFGGVRKGKRFRRAFTHVFNWLRSSWWLPPLKRQSPTETLLARTAPCLLRISGISRESAARQGRHPQPGVPRATGGATAIALIATWPPVAPLRPATSR